MGGGMGEYDKRQETFISSSLLLECKYKASNSESRGLRGRPKAKSESL